MGKQQTDPIKESRKKLFQFVSPTVDIGEEGYYNERLDTPDGRKKFFDNVSPHVNIGTFEEFEAKVFKKKRPDEVSGKGLEPPSKLPTAPSKPNGKKPEVKETPFIRGMRGEGAIPPEAFSSISSLVKAATQTALHTAPASTLDAYVAEIRSHKGTIDQLKLRKEKGDKSVENINVESAQRIKASIDEATGRITDLQNQRDSKLRALESGVSAYGKDQELPPDVQQNKDRLTAELRDLDLQISEASKQEEARMEAFNAYMGPILQETGNAANEILTFTQDWIEKGQERFGKDLKMTSDQIEDLGSFLDYVASNVGQSLPYSVLALTGGAMNMVRIEQGSIEADIINTLMEEKGMTLRELLDSGIDQKGAGIAITSGIKAGLMESAGEAITLLAPWAKLGLKAGTIMSKTAFTRLLNKSLNASGRMLTAAGAEGLTENRQTKEELSAVLQALGYSESQIESMITWDDLKEATFAGIVASSGMAAPSTAVRIYVDRMVDRKLERQGYSKESIFKMSPEAKGEAIKTGGIEKAKLAVKKEVKEDPKTAAEVIDKEQEDIVPEDVESVDSAAERIQTKIEEEDAIQKRETEEVPVREPAEVSEKVVEGVPAKEEITTEAEIEEIPEGLIYLSKNKNAAIIRNDEGKVIVVKKDGTEFSRRQSLDYINESIENYKPNQFEATEIPDGIKEHEINDHLIEESNNPIEIAEAYIATQGEDINFEKNEIVSEMVEGGMPKVTFEALKNEIPEEKITPAIKKQFVDEKATILNFEEIVEEINDDAGTPGLVTRDDLVNHVLGFTGDKPKTERAINLDNLNRKFQELTGRTLNPKLAEDITSKQITSRQVDLLEKANIALEEAGDKELAELKAFEDEWYKIIEEERKPADITRAKEDKDKGKEPDRGIGAKEQIGEGVEILARLSGITKGIAPVEGDSYAKAIKLIGDGLIAAGKATLENVAQKVKEYIANLGYKDITDEQINDVYPPAKKPPQPTKKKVEPKEGKKKKRYESRQLAEFSSEDKIVAAIKENGLTFETVSWMRVNPMANEMIAKAIADTKDAVKNIQALIEEINNTPISAFTGNEELSTLYALIYHKALDYLKNNGEIKLFKKYSNAFSETGREFGRFISAMQADSSPEAISNRVTASLLEGKEEVLEQESESGKIISEEISEIQEKLKLTEDEVAKLNGIVDDLTKKLSTKRTRQTESNADRIRNAQAKRTKATNTINALLKKSRGQLSAGLPLNILADPEMLKAIRDVIASYIEEGIYRADDIKSKILDQFKDDKEFQAEVDKNWGSIYDEDFQDKALDEQALAFIAALAKRAKTNAIVRQGKKQSPEQILLDTLLAKVDETVKKQKGKPKQSAIVRVREGIMNRMFSDEVWAEAMENVALWLDTAKSITPERKAQILGDLQESVSQFMDTPFAIADLRRAIMTGAKDLNIAIQEVVKKHWTEQNKDMNTMAERLILELALPVEDALAIQSRVEREVKTMFEETKRKEIYKILGLDKDGKKKGKTDRKAKRSVDTVIEAINLGMLDESHFQDLFAEKYGFTTLTEKDITQIKRFNDLINKHQGNEMSRFYMQELMNYVEGLKAWDAEKVYNSYLSLMIRSMLTGLSTIAVNIPVGSYLAYKANTIPRFLANPVATIQAIRAFKKAGLTGIGRLTFMDIMKNGYNILDEGMAKFDDRKDTRGDYIDYLLNTYDAKAMGKAVKGAKTAKAKANAIAVLSARTFLKIYQLANFAKAFDVLINHKGEELSYFIDEYNEQAKASGHNSFLVRYNFAAGMKIAEAVKKKMGYDARTVADLKAEVEEEIAAMRDRGETVGKGLAQRLLKAKMQALRDHGMLQRARDFVKTSTLMEAPQGVLGMLYEKTTQGLSIKNDTDWTKGLLKATIKSAVGLFLRITVTSAQRAMENVPIVGLTIPGTFYDYKMIPVDPKKPQGAQKWDWQWQDPKKRNARIMVHASTLGIMTAAVMSMFDWDDEEGLVLDPDRWIDITGYGTGQYKDIEQLNRINVRDKSVRERKNFMLSIRMDDKWFDIIPARLMPQLLPVIAILGSMRDEAELEPDVFKEKGELEHFVKAFDDIGLALTEQTFATIPRFVSKTVYAGQREGVRGVFAEFGYAVANPLKSTVYPNMLRDVNNEIHALYGDTKKSGATGTKILFRDLPVLEDMMLYSTHDIFGYPIKKESKIILSLENNPALNLVIDNLTEFKNINKERYEEDVWQVKMLLHPDLVMKGYWARGETYELKMLGVEAYGLRMRELWEKDLAGDRANSKIRNKSTIKLDEFIHKNSIYGWHRKASKAAKKAIEKAKEEKEIKK